MTDPFSQYSFHSATSHSQSSSRKRPRRLRVKKYVESLQTSSNNGGGGAMSSSIDMTGHINDSCMDDGNAATTTDIEGDHHHHYDDNSDLLSLQSRQSSISTHTSAAAMLSGKQQQQPESLLLQQQQQKSNFLGRIRHSLMAEEVVTLQVPIKEPAVGKTKTNEASAPLPAKKLLLEQQEQEQSSSDGDEFFSYHKRLGETMDGAFPSNTTTIIERQESILTSSSDEIQGSTSRQNTTTNHSTSRRSTTSLSSRLSSHSSQRHNNNNTILTSSDESQHHHNHPNNNNSNNNGVASIASSAKTESARNTTSRTSASPQEEEDEQADSDELWNRVVEAQSDDESISRSSSSSSSSSSPIRDPISLLSTTVKAATTATASDVGSGSRYEAYRASVGGKDEKPWAAATSTTDVSTTTTSTEKSNVGEAPQEALRAVFPVVVAAAAYGKKEVPLDDSSEEEEEESSSSHTYGSEEGNVVLPPSQADENAPPSTPSRFHSTAVFATPCSAASRGSSMDMDDKSIKVSSNNDGVVKHSPIKAAAAAAAAARAAVLQFSSPAAGNSIFDDDSTDAEPPSIYQDTSFDQYSSASPPQRSKDDDGGFPSTASMLQVARSAGPPQSSPGVVSKDFYGVNDNDDDDSDSYISSDESGEEYEIDMQGEEDYIRQNDDSPHWRLEENEEDSRRTAKDFAAAAMLQQGTLRDIPAPKVFQEEDSESNRMELISVEDTQRVTQQPRAKSLDHLNYMSSSTRKSKRFQMWTEHGVYIRSSDSSSSDSSESSAATEPLPVVMSQSRESMYDKNASGSWRKSLGALFRWRYTEPKQTEEAERIELAPKQEGVLEEYGMTRSIQVQVTDDDEEERKNRARMLASAALFKKDDLQHVEEQEKVKAQPDPTDPKSFHASLAAAVAVRAKKRQERMADTEESYENSTRGDRNIDAEADVSQGSLAAQVAMLARRKNSTRSADEFDKLYKKEPPKKEEPRLMVQLRPVKKDLSNEEKKTEEVDDSVPALMVQLKPIASLSRQQEEGSQIREPSKPAKIIDTNENQVDLEKGSRPWHQLGSFGTRGENLEAYQAFSEPSSAASSVTNVEQVYDEDKMRSSVGVSRYCTVFVVVLALMAAIALPLYFFVFADDARGTSSPDNGSGGISPPFTTPSVSPTQFSPSQEPTGPTLVPQPVTTTSTPTSEISAPTSSPSFPTVAPSLRPSLTTTQPDSTPTLSPGQELENLLVASWPPLEGLLNDPDNASSPQMQAFDWLSEDTNLNIYSDAQKIQRFSMATFFYSTGGENWVVSEGWLSDEDECRWYSSSVRDACDDSGNLAYLDLTENGLSGSLPVELAMLSNSLTRVLLSGDSSENAEMSSLVGPIPLEYGLLSKLEVLTLNNHRISGTIPSQIGQLTALSVLDVEGNELSGTLPTSIGRLQALNNLYMAFNRFSGVIPAEIGQLSLLVNLDLLGNRLSGSLPPEIGHLPIIQSISLGSNRIEGTIPTQIGGLSNLQGSVNLASNLLTGTIPTELGQLQQIRISLNLSSNKLSGSLPFHLGRLVNLRSLELQNNELTGLVPIGFSSLLKLEELRLESNNLSGSVPLFVCQSLVTDKVFNKPTFFVTDCMGEIECSCCQYCCGDDIGCECQFANTDNDFLCIDSVLEEDRFSLIP